MNTNTIELGKTYALKNGTKVTCIGIAGDLAWMRPRSETVAFAFTLDGKDVDGDDGWDVVFKHEWMEGFGPTETDLNLAFYWDHTPEGGDFWAEQAINPTTEGLARWLEMHAEYARANQNA